MKTIWKYRFPIEDVVVLPIPTGHEILDVQGEGGELYLWVLVDPNKPLNEVGIAIYETGHLVNEDYGKWNYIKTVITNEGFLVWHIFEIKYKTPSND